jgi:hypothetical protein
VRRVFIFETTHHALRAEQVAAESSIAAQVIPAPPLGRARCDLALECFIADEDRLATALRAAGVPFEVLAA